MNIVVKLSNLAVVLEERQNPHCPDLTPRACSHCFTKPGKKRPEQIRGGNNRETAGVRAGGWVVYDERQQDLPRRPRIRHGAEAVHA